MHEQHTETGRNLSFWVEGTSMLSDLSHLYFFKHM